MPTTTKLLLFLIIKNNNTKVQPNPKFKRVETQIRLPM